MSVLSVSCLLLIECAFVYPFFSQPYPRTLLVTENVALPNGLLASVWVSNPCSLFSSSCSPW